ncbi:hypothetical protein [Zobellia sp. 1_MG-2023]|uniref:hypothetical protein n=1 Tax=Zobellia sp. 1_MG-2023 TaxID=3062626 RepID=UPI0026E40F5C|nr:hypothetical protein [Zobellia sp. 1_MG-2023]MDO6820311.1 hypothetical protein [Zobellia sp. 1_MG-2023]
MRKFVVMALLVVSANSFAQKMKVSKGDIKNLKDISAYTLEFDYSNLEIPKYDSEDDFLEDKMAKREEKEAGKGEEFKKSWFADRQDRYEPKFIESFNKRFDDGEVSVSMEDADYTMKIHTNKIYAGYNVGVVRKNAEIDAIITVYETANPSNVLLEGKYSDVQGYGAMGNDYNSGYRISECYAKLAKNMAGFIIKKALK